MIGEPAACVEDGMPLLMIRLGHAFSRPRLRGDAARQFLAEERARLFAKCLLFGSETEIHQTGLSGLPRQLDGRKWNRE